MRILIALLMLVAIGVSAEQVEPDYVLDGIGMKVTVHVYPNKGAMIKAYKELTGNRTDPVDNDGFALWNAKVERHGLGKDKLLPPDEPTCQIHIVMPKIVDQQEVTKSWGHELMHCVMGNFHD